MLCWKWEATMPQEEKKTISQTFELLPIAIGHLWKNHRILTFFSRVFLGKMALLLKRICSIVACPFVIPGLLNESRNRFLSRWHLHQGVQLAILCRISFPWDRGKTLYWMQVNSFLSSCLGKRPLQTSCLSEALTSSALIALTGSGWLFTFPFSQNHHCDWFEGEWSHAVWSIQLTVVETDTRGIWRLCVLCNKLWNGHQMSWVKYVLCFINKAAQVN